MTASKSKSKPAPASATDAPAQVTAHAGPPAPAPTLLKQASKFLNTTAGLDLTLRLFQGFVIISAKASEPVLSTRSLVASSQLDLARRYLRFFVLLDCVQNLFETSAKDYASLTYKTLDMVEWSCLLMYFILENLTMLHDMKIHVLPWYHPVLVEANKFWFAAILTSIIRTIIQRADLFAGAAADAKPTTSSKEVGEKKQQPPPQPQVVRPAPPPLRRLIIDALDLTLPASFIGWVVIDDVTIGCLMTISTVLVWRDVWAKAQ